MKQNRYLAFAGLAVVGVFAAWMVQTQFGAPSQPASPEPAVDDESYTFTYGDYTVLAAESSIQARGDKPLLDNYVDTATVQVQRGSLSVTEAGVSGELVIDMTSLTALSTGRNAGEEMLTRHLKSDDFFAVETYPTATFVVTGMSTDDEGNATVTGDLTLKGITNEIQVPVSVVGRDGQPVVRADFQLDRTLWDVRFGSGKFFQNIGDNLIDDMFDISVELVGERVN